MNLPEPPELVRGTLPDPGPRFERLTESPDWSQFEQGMALYHQGHYVEARFHFAAMLQEQRDRKDSADRAERTMCRDWGMNASSFKVDSAYW